MSEVTIAPPTEQPRFDARDEALLAEVDRRIAAAFDRLYDDLARALNAPLSDREAIPPARR